MKVVKRVFFEAEGEKVKLTELAKSCKNSNELSLEVESKFGLNFSDAIFIAEYWFNLVKNK